MSCTLNELASAKNLTADYLSSLGLTDTTAYGQTAVEIPYLDKEGNIESVRYRMNLTGNDRFRWKKESTTQPYGRWMIGKVQQEWPSCADTLLIVEGESDCWAAWMAGYPCLGLPGATNTNHLTLDDVTGFSAVYVWQEPDKAGEGFPARVKAQLTSLGYTGKVKAIKRPPYKDISDLYSSTIKNGKDECGVNLELSSAIQQAVEIELSEAMTRGGVGIDDPEYKLMPRLKWDDFEAALNRKGLRIKHAGGGKYMAQCPAHDDSDPSLSITVYENGDCWMKCQSQGCGFDSIVKALGLEEEYEAAKTEKRPDYLEAKRDAEFEAARTRSAERKSLGTQPDDAASLLRGAQQTEVAETNTALKPTEAPSSAIVDRERPLQLPIIPGCKRFDFSTIGACRLFAQYLGSDIRHAYGWGWLLWTGSKWEMIPEEYLYPIAHRFADEIYLLTNALPNAKAGSEEGRLKKDAMKWSNSLRSVSGTKAMLEFAATEGEIKAEVAQFDTDPDLFNCRNGTINLKTGELQPHNKLDYITRICPVDYCPSAKSELFEKVIERAMNNEPEMIGFLQRYHGYGLTGHVGEQCFLYDFGIGANSKSVTVESIMSTMGDYACKARTETIVASKKPSGSDASPDIASLYGKRLVVLAEVEQGARMAESRIKDLTGGDTITCRRLYQDPFSFKPEFKLVVYGNHRLEITGTDDGIWRRVRMVPFEVQIPESERDPHLMEKLREPENQQGILAWLVRGATEYYRMGLQTPGKVENSTNAYRAENDTIGQWMEEKCACAPGVSGKSSLLYADYKDWAEEAGEREISQKAFSTALAQRGLLKKITGDGAYFFGISLRKK